MTKKRRVLIENEDDCDILSRKRLKSNQSDPVPVPVVTNGLCNLPVELKVIIFKNLSLKELSVLATVCKPFCDIIISHFLLNRECLLTTFKTVSKTGTADDFLQTAADLGLLIKRATFIFPSNKRIQLITTMFQIVDLKSNLRLIYANDRPAFKHFTRAIKCALGKLISGWKFKEALKLVDEIELYFNNSKLLMLVMTKEFGAARQDEQYLRFFYRKILFECFEDNTSRAKWLHYFLNYHTNFTSDQNQKITFQGKLMLLLFSPIFQEENSELVYIDWFCFSNTIFLREGLEYLGFAFKLLNSLKPKSRPDVFALFRTVTNIGLFWLFENSSTLLYHSGANIIKQTIDYLLKRENIVHVIRYMANMFIIESKLLVLGKIRTDEKIMGSIYEHLKGCLPMGNLDCILDLIASEFMNIARATETLTDDREYLDASEIVGGILQFYKSVV